MDERNATKDGSPFITSRQYSTAPSKIDLTQAPQVNDKLHTSTSNNRAQLEFMFIKLLLV